MSDPTAPPDPSAPPSRASKIRVTLRLDRAVVDFFKNAGPLYQTRINAVLRAYMDHQRKAGACGPRSP